jgi:hypothetical protein
MHKVITAPAERFAALKEKPTWVLPLILSLFVPGLLIVVASVLLPRKTLVEAGELRMQKARTFVQAQVERTGGSASPRAQEALEQVEAQGAKQIDKLKTMPAVEMLGRNALGVVISGLLHGAVLLLFTVVLNFLMPVMGAATHFRRALAVTANAALVRVVGAVVAAATMLAANKPAVATGLGLVVENARNLMLKGFVSCFDVFTIWELALVSAGLGVMFGVGARKAAIPVFGIWLIYCLLVAVVYSLSGGLIAPL